MNRLNVKTFLAGHDCEVEVIQQEYCAQRNKTTLAVIRVSGILSAEIINQHINDAINNQPKTEVKEVLPWAGKTGCSPVRMRLERGKPSSHLHEHQYGQADVTLTNDPHLDWYACNSR